MGDGDPVDDDPHGGDPDGGAGYDGVVRALAELADPDGATQLQRFFRTGPGEYGEGDVFLGVRVPAIRKVVARFADLPLPEVDALLDSPVHEHRLAGLLIVVRRFERASAIRTRSDADRGLLADFYLSAVLRGRVNNWDLVDASAERILGGWLHDRPRDQVFALGADAAHRVPRRQRRRDGCDRALVRHRAPGRRRAGTLSGDQNSISRRSVTGRAWQPRM